MWHVIQNENMIAFAQAHRQQTNETFALRAKSSISLAVHNRLFSAIYFHEHGKSANFILCHTAFP